MTRAARRTLILVAVGMACTSAAHAEEEAPHDAWLRKHVFTGYDDCISVSKEQKIEPGEHLLVFETNKPPRSVQLAYRISGEDAQQVFRTRGYRGVYQDSVLWDSIGCVRMFTDENPEWIVRLKRVGAHLPLVIQGLSRSALIVGGAAREMSPAEVARAADGIRARLPVKFTSAGVLRVGYHFRSPDGHDITRLFLGRAFYRRGTSAPGAPASIDSVQICEVLLHQDRLLTTEEYSRVSGEMERAETEPPELDTRNWYDVQSRTMGFFSLDNGATWRHVTVDVGFEGIYWSIRGLTTGFPILWDSYLYTAH